MIDHEHEYGGKGGSAYICDICGEARPDDDRTMRLIRRMQEHDRLNNPTVTLESLAILTSIKPQGMRDD